MKKKVIRLTEGNLRRIVNKSVRKALMEAYYDTNEGPSDEAFEEAKQLLANLHGANRFEANGEDHDNTALIWWAGKTRYDEGYAYLTESDDSLKNYIVNDAESYYAFLANTFEKSPEMVTQAVMALDDAFMSEGEEPCSKEFAEGIIDDADDGDFMDRQFVLEAMIYKYGVSSVIGEAVKPYKLKCGYILYA